MTYEVTTSPSCESVVVAPPAGGATVVGAFADDLETTATFVVGAIVAG